LATSSLVRSRLRLSALAVATIATGLATRRVPAAFPEVLATFGGDVLWATLMYWLLAWLRPSAAAPRLACAAGQAMAREPEAPGLKRPPMEWREPG